MNKVKRYQIIESIMLSFIGPDGTVDYLIGPADNIKLEANEHTIWAKDEYSLKESITTANAIDIWLKQGKIKEI